MATTATRQGDQAEVVASNAPTAPSERLALIRMLAAAHVAAGAIIALSVAGNVALGIRYTGGPMGTLGVQSVGLAAFLNNTAHLSAWDRARFWVQYPTYAGTLNRHAQSSPVFFRSLAMVHLSFAGLLIGIGYGLWRRRAWARKADSVLVSICATSGMAHAIILLASGFGYSELGIQALAVTALVAGPALALLLSPRTAVLFEETALPFTDPAQARRWWTLSVQFLLALVVGAFALGFVRLLYLGPIVEIVWAVAVGARDGIGF